MSAPLPPPSLLSHASKLRHLVSTLSLHTLAAKVHKLPRFPPPIYFLSLVLAGVGVPVSEDLLVMYAYLTTPPKDQAATAAAIFLGVVISDVTTFEIGSRTGDAISLPRPVRKLFLKLNLVSSTPTTSALFKFSRLSSFLTGFGIRLSVGIRGPLMLAAGASGRVRRGWYMAGTCLGGFGSMALQAGLAMRLLR
ncbi:hypothetical protein TeGR_g10410 [Tetraparma gracilis]|uniref:Uncharacterized protein n=1 Tax=Tetraparma gracilis TaxID=2962635 RepID=A0ABQ6MBV4_9STRA|nr:hypothetical protein TeGR_g10410 [Tetraparma gracilis]